MGLFIAAFSIFFAACPLLLVAMVIWSADVYNRKPIWTGLIAIFWGAFFATTSVLGIQFVLEIFITGIWNITGARLENIQAVIIAPTMEEITKGIILLILLFVPRSFESGTNGLVLGALAGVGFAITENFMYYINTYYMAGPGAWIATIIIRTLFSTFIHVMASGVIGFCLGLGASRGHNPIEMIVLLMIGYVVAVGIHLVWNLSATLGEISAGFVLVGFLSFFLAAFCILMLGLGSVFYDRRILQREFEDEIHQGVLSQEDSFILTRWTRRDALRFVFPGKLSSEFQKTALRLAVIKHQNRHYKKPKRESEIQRLRSNILEMKHVTNFIEQEMRQKHQHQNLPGMDLFAQQRMLQPNMNFQNQQHVQKPNNPPPFQSLDSRPDNPPQNNQPNQPYVGMSNLPQKPPEYLEQEEQPPVPHSIRIINPSEFRRKVKKHHHLGDNNEDDNLDKYENSDE